MLTTQSQLRRKPLGHRAIFPISPQFIRSKAVLYFVRSTSSLPAGKTVSRSLRPWVHGYAGSVNPLRAQELRAGQAHGWLADPWEVVRLS